MTAATPLPQVDGLPVVGNLFDLSTPNIRHFLTRSYLLHGPIFQIQALGQRIIVMAGPEANQFMTKQGHHHFRSDETWGPNDKEFGARFSMVSSDGEMHRFLRKMEGRAFSRSYFVQHARKALVVAAEELSAVQVGQVLEVGHWCKSVVTEQIARISASGTARPYLDDLLFFIQRALMMTVTRQLLPLAALDPRYQRAKKNVMSMTDQLIAEHQTNPPSEGGRYADLIDDALHTWQERPDLLNYEEVRLTALGPFIAGMDTAANTLAFMLYRLQKHPQYLPELQAEADAFFASGLAQFQEVGKLKKLHHFIMETMRLHPIAPSLNRTVKTSFEFAGHTVPEGAQVIVATTVPHGLPECFADPERFDPSRFERGEHRKAGAYAPFGLGSHVCAGSGYAETLLMVNAAAILHTLELEGDPNYVLRQVARPTPSPDDHFQLRVRQIRHPAVQLLA